MTHIEPPRQATWMLERLTSSTRNEALAGDLLEELRAGRSKGWYWRQVLSAIMFDWTQQWWRRRAMLVFAALWCLLAPAWQLLWTREFFEGNFVGHIWRLPWPWSTICASLVGIFDSLLFAWLGAALFAAASPFGLNRHRVRELAKGFVWSTLIYAVFWTAAFAMAALAAPRPVSQAINWRTLTMLGVTLDFTFWPLLSRVIYLPVVGCALWFLSPGLPARATASQTPAEPNSI